MSLENTNKTSWSGKFKQLLQKYSLFFILIVFMIICTAVNENFLTAKNLINVCKQQSVIIILALGEMILITAGLLDLACGSVVAFSGCLAITVYQFVPSVTVAALCSIAVAIICNFMSGAMVTFFKAPAFIATLAMQAIARGAVLFLCDGKNIYDLGNITVLGQNDIGVIPVPVIIMLLCFLFVLYLTRQTKLGRSFYAVGGNEQAAIAAGINVYAVKMKSYIINGALTGIAAIVYAARVNAGLPNGAQSYEFDALTATIIGGTSFSGGVSSAVGTVLGAFLVGFLTNIMNLVGINSYLQQIVRGAIIAFAVIWDIASREQKTYKKGKSKTHSPHAASAQ